MYTNCLIGGYHAYIKYNSSISSLQLTASGDSLIDKAKGLKREVDFITQISK